MCILKGEDLHKMHLFDVFRESSYLQYPGTVCWSCIYISRIFSINEKGTLQFGGSMLAIIGYSRFYEFFGEKFTIFNEMTFDDIFQVTVFSLKNYSFSVSLQSQARLQLQLAPSLEHQVAAMLSILARYNWQQFSVVTSEIAGHDDFIQAVRDRVAFMKAQELFR